MFDHLFGKSRQQSGQSDKAIGEQWWAEFQRNFIQAFVSINEASKLRTPDISSPRFHQISQEQSLRQNHFFHEAYNSLATADRFLAALEESWKDKKPGLGMLRSAVAAYQAMVRDMDKVRELIGSNTEGVMDLVEIRRNIQQMRNHDATAKDLLLRGLAQVGRTLPFD